ncbi:hypothetical protein ACOI1C_00505 [Bacillus sp. DJP31]|uniref:hypothetical protein n=1 Tax=Bacillus sp. DJP31 TaxID=3409789 RepID=UPI003BB4B2E7
MVFIVGERNTDKLDTHMKFFFTKGGGVFTMIFSPFEDEKFPYHLISLVNHEILQCYNDLPTLEQIKEEIGEFEEFHTDKVIVEGKEKGRKKVKE